MVGGVWCIYGACIYNLCDSDQNLTYPTIHKNKLNEYSNNW